MGFLTWTSLAHVLVSTSAAQISSNTTCADLEPWIGFNASVTRRISALRVNGSRYDLSAHPSWDFSIQNDTSRTWALKLGVKAAPNTRVGDFASYYHTLLIDTSGVNTTEMGMCHHTIAPELNASGFQWSKETLERSLRDTGDCQALLGLECINALKSWYGDQAASVGMVQGSCAQTNNSIPPECAGFPKPTLSQTMNLTQDLSATAVDPRRNITTHMDPSLQCDGMNASTTHATPLNGGMSYDAAVRFPLIDIMTVWPNLTSRTYYQPGWISDVHVEISCLKPSDVAMGSRSPPSGRDLLDAQDAKFPKSGTGGLRRGGIGWMVGVVLGVVMVV